MYCSYSKPVSSIIKHHGLLYHTYADDSQLYFTLTPEDDLHQFMEKIVNCVNDIQRWMSQNLLKLNEEKTELIFFMSKKNAHICNGLTVKFAGGATINPSTCVKNLGSWWDSHCTMERHISEVIRSCNFQLRLISYIRRFISKDATRTLVQSLVISRLDYTNGLLHGITKGLLTRLQRVQNRAARLVAKIPYCNHVQPILRELHWLPVQQRIQFKILLLTFKALNGHAPDYLSKLVSVYQPARPLRSGTKLLLTIPRSHTAMYSRRSYTLVAPVLWNSLPESVRAAETVTSFKRRLKTHLFISVYH